MKTLTTPRDRNPRAAPPGPIAAIAVTLMLLGAVAFAPGAGAQSSAPGADAATAPGVPSADKQVVLITGSTSGLGRELALRLAATGAHIIVHGRDRERGEEVVAEIEREGTGSARFYAADLASHAEVRAFGEAVLRDYDRLDVLINNAGIGSRIPAERTLSQDGVELRFAVNYLSHFLLTRMLLPRVVESAPARIVNVSSGSQTPIDFDDVMLEQDYSGGRAYGQSKLAQILFTFDLAEELEGTGVVVSALHPSTYMDTNMILGAGLTPRSSVNDGADAVMRLITEPDLESGQYFSVQRPTRANQQAYDEEARAMLRRLSMELTGMR